MKVLHILIEIQKFSDEIIRQEVDKTYDAYSLVILLGPVQVIRKELYYRDK